MTTSKERMAAVMSGERPDRVPVMCQLSLGHMVLHSDVDLVDFWFTSEGFAEANMRLTDKYRFDGILLNLTGRDPVLKSRIRRVEAHGDGHLVRWKNGDSTFIPPDDFPRPVNSDSRAPKEGVTGLNDVLVDDIPVHESAASLPAYFYDILDYVLPRRGESHSIHGEVSTAFGRYLAACGGYENGFMGLLDDPPKAREVIARCNQSVLVEALAQCSRGIDALNLSSPYAGAGFISREMYEAYVLPYEREIISAVHMAYGIPCYIHTCGAIGDRLDLLAATGIDGLDCLDPPPLGTVELEDAVAEIGDRLFIKGNLDSVNELLGAEEPQVHDTVKSRLTIGKRSRRGYILSTACSVAPRVSPMVLEMLSCLAEQHGGFASD